MVCKPGLQAYIKGKLYSSAVCERGEDRQKEEERASSPLPFEPERELTSSFPRLPQFSSKSPVQHASEEPPYYVFLTTYIRFILSFCFLSLSDV